jgi:hypothetical protein
VVVALLMATACGEPAEYRFGTNLTGLRFKPISPTEGVYPSRIVMSDPNNPFRNWPLLNDAKNNNTKWRLLEGGASVGAFYAWATALAGEPTGENQFYTARLLGEIALTGAVESPDAGEQVRLMAIAGYQSMLDNFPDAVSFNEAGTVSFRLATPAYTAIGALDGGVLGGWVLVNTPTGPQAVRSAPALLDGGR